MKPSPGEKAPQLKLTDEQGRAVKLADFRGKKVVLYFYPRDLTPGCTKEACAFQDDLAEFEKRNAVVLGVSTDDARSHRRFREKYGLGFPLLTDAEHETAESYGVWQEKNMYGRKVWGIKRTTFIIDEQGRIGHVFDKVSPAEHSREVLDALDNLKKI
ncbi:MAG TPA: thioredoxin-dependent thiol peroxidase [Blastocatellia bacterium]|jgi:peroxiredoxin Q/BCP|nr:thioredoxin-dependent thiol peroxidase [Blastocatellia bacterium]